MATSTKTVTYTRSELYSLYTQARSFDADAALKIYRTINTMDNLGAVKANVTLYYTTSGSISYVTDLTVNWMESANGTRLQ